MPGRDPLGLPREGRSTSELAGMGYETVVDSSELVWTMIGYVTHATMLGLQLFLALFLLISGAVGFVRPRSESAIFRRLGATHLGSSDARSFGFLRMVLGALMLLPAVMQAPWQVSLLASGLALGLLFWLERGLAADQRRTGRWLRVTSIAAAAMTFAFIVWERDDSIALGARVLFKMQEWRSHELAWQLANDPRSPKVGQPAPDFELADPSGAHTARLSDFKGKRPVALVFGSYT